MAATFAVAVAGLIYELIAATVAAYLQGDSVRQFSFVIGVFLFAMGVGAWASRFVREALPGFVATQIGLGVIGGAAGPLLFLAYAWTGEIAVPLYGSLLAIGALSGMEIPLIARVLRQIGAERFRFENVLAADYVGALVASLAFPLLIVPNLTLVAASLAFGALNLMVAGGTLWLFRADLSARIWPVWGAALAACLAGLALSGNLVRYIDARLYADDVIYSEATAYQRITVTRFRDRTRLYLDDAIQFDSRDEHRYHEMLVHPAMAHAPRRARVLVLGGGDGMAVREVLRWPEVEAVTVVDLDPAVTTLFRDNPDLAALNDGALGDARVRIVTADAFAWAEWADAVFDVIIADLPDPRTLSLSRLYSLEFYALLAERRAAHAPFVTQAGSPLFARRAFWTVAATLAEARAPAAAEAGQVVVPYHVYVPSFGAWGFVLALPAAPADRPIDWPEGLRYLTAQTWDAARVFPPDMARVEARPNTLQGHSLLQAYLDGWEDWFR